MTKQPNRKFPISDALMLRGAEERLMLLQGEINRFVAHFPEKFPEDYVSSLRDRIVTARKTYTDTVYLKGQAQATEKLDHLETQFELLSRKIHLHAKDAFPDQTFTVELFDIGTPGKTKNRRLAFANSLPGFVELIQRYKTELKAAGMKEETFTEATTLAAKIASQQTDRIVTKIERNAATGERRNLMNGIWETLEEVAEAATVVHFGDDEKIQQYALPKRKKSKKEESDNSINPA